MKQEKTKGRDKEKELNQRNLTATEEKLEFFLCITEARPRVIKRQ